MLPFRVIYPEFQTLKNEALENQDSIQWKVEVIDFADPDNYYNLEWRKRKEKKMSSMAKKSCFSMKM